MNIIVNACDLFFWTFSVRLKMLSKLWNTKLNKLARESSNNISQQITQKFSSKWSHVSESFCVFFFFIKQALFLVYDSDFCKYICIGVL